MTPEQSYLTGLVREAFNHIEWYDTIGYKSGFFSGEMMAEDVGREAGERNYRLFRASEFCKIADDALSYYVLSSQFKNDLRQDYFREEREEGKPIPDLPLDGSVEIRLDSVGKVRNYLIEVSRLGGLFEYNEPFREWFSRQFLHTLDDRNEYVRGSFERMLRQSTGRRITFDDALGYEISAQPENNPPYFSEEVRRNLESLMGDRIKNKPLHEIIVDYLHQSPLYAVLFSHPVVQFSAFQGVTHSAGSIHDLRLQLFLNRTKEGIIPAFTLFTPYPELDSLEPTLLREEDSLASMQRAAELYPSWIEPCRIRQLPVDKALASPASFGEIVQYFFRMGLTRKSCAFKRMKWNEDEKELFSRKAINHLLHDPKAYTILSRAGFSEPHSWPAVIEFLERQDRAVLDFLVKEATTHVPQRLEDKIKKGELNTSRKRFTSESYPSREIECRGQKYVMEIDRSFVSIVNILYDHIQHSNSSEATAKILQDFDHQFISVYTLDRDRKELLGAVWLKGSQKRLEGSKPDYSDEIAPVRSELLQYAHEFAHHCGYTTILFNPGEMIEEVK